MEGPESKIGKAKYQRILANVLTPIKTNKATKANIDWPKNIDESSMVTFEIMFLTKEYFIVYWWINTFQKQDDFGHFSQNQKIDSEK